METKKDIRREFRKAVFERDGYRCVMCGNQGVDRQGVNSESTNLFAKVVPLDAHHIIDRHDFENGGYVKENGITVCTECHLKAEQFHISGGKEWPEGFHPEDLYAKIGSALTLAIEADLATS